MIEGEWLAYDNPTRMLEFLRDRASARKLRLFACACCRAVWDLMTDERSRRAVEVSERFADGLARKKELKQAKSAAYWPPEAAHTPEEAAAWAAAYAADDYAPGAAEGAAEVVASLVLSPEERERSKRLRAEELWTMERPQLKEALAGVWGRVHLLQCNLIREIVGNVFRPLTVDTALFEWRGRLVPKLAQTIYEARAFDRLPILADALEEAGCQDAEILSHLRGPGPHVRGCFVLDALLNKG